MRNRHGMGSRHRRDRTRDQSGSATVLAVVLVGVLTVVALGAVAGGGVLVAQRRAAAAADLAALAAAEATGVSRVPVAGVASGLPREQPCDVADRVSDANGARLTGCRVDGSEVVVEVEVDAATIFGAVVAVTAAARAGPAPARAGPAAGVEAGIPATGWGGPSP
jgi:secretion/DNA translocation related TadE-like protein